MATNPKLQFKIIKGPPHIKITKVRNLGGDRYEIWFHPDSKHDDYSGELIVEVKNSDNNIVSTIKLHLTTPEAPELEPVGIVVWEEGTEYTNGGGIFLKIKQKYDHNKSQHDFDWALTNAPSWLKIGKSGIIDIKKGQKAQAGHYTLKVKVTDHIKNKKVTTKRSSEHTIQLQVNTADLSPTLKGGNRDISLDVYQYTELRKVLEIINPAKDKKKNPLEVSLYHVNGTDTFSYNATQQTFSGTPTDEGIYKYKLIASNKSKHELVINITVNVLQTKETENAPIISKVPDNPTIYAGEELHFQIGVSNPHENAPLEYWIEDVLNSNWIEFDENTGMLTGRPEITHPTEGIIRVTNTLEISSRKSFHIDVKGPRFRVENIPSGEVKQYSLYKSALKINNPTDQPVSIDLQLPSDITWLKLDPSTNILQGTPTNSNDVIGKIILSNIYGKVTYPFTLKIIPHVGSTPKIITPDFLESIIKTPFAKIISIKDDPTQKETTKLTISLSSDQFTYHTPTPNHIRIHGTPDKAEDITATITATNEHGTNTKVVSIIVSEHAQNDHITPKVNSNITINAAINKLFDYNFKITNPKGIDQNDIKITVLQQPATFKVSTFSATRVLHGTPKEIGNEYALLKVTNSVGGIAYIKILIKVAKSLSDHEEQTEDKPHQIKSKSTEKREKELLEFLSTGKFSVLLNMTTSDDVPNYTQNFYNKGKAKLVEMKESLGMWTLDKLDRHVLIPFKEWGTVSIKNPIKKKVKKLNESITNKLISTARNRESSFRGIALTRLKLSRYKKRKGKSTILFIISQMVKNSLEKVGDIVDKAKDLVRGTNAARNFNNWVGNQTTGKWIKVPLQNLTSTRYWRNLASKLDTKSLLKLEKNIGNGLVKAKKVISRTYLKAEGVIVRAKTLYGKVTPFFTNASKVVSNALSFRALGTGVIFAAGANAFGLGIPAAIAASGLGVGVGAVKNAIIHLDPDIATGALGNFAKNHGVNQFRFDKLFEASPTAQQEALETLAKRGGNIFTKSATAFRSFGTAMTFGSIGMMVGGPAGAMVGAGVGAVGQIAYDRIAGKAKGTAIKSLLKQIGAQKITPLTRLASLPLSTVINMAQGNFWLLHEMDRLINEYNGDFGRYLAENWLGKDKFQTFINLAGSFGYVSAAWQMAKTMISGNLLKGLTLQTTFTNLGKFKLTGSMLIGGVLGSAIGLMIAGALGISMGAGALMGAAIGGTIGTLGGAIISGVIGGSTGLGFLASTAIVTVTTAFGTTVGAWLGSFFDKGLKSLTSGIMGTMNAMQAMLALTKFMSGPLNSDNAVMFLFSIISLLTLMERSADQSGSSDNATPADPETEQTGGYNFNKVDLEYYNITLLDGETDIWDQMKITRLLSVLQQLEKDGTEFDKLNKTIFLTLGEDTIYEGEEFILVSIQSDKFYRLEYQELVSEELSTLSNFTPAGEKVSFIN